MSTTVGAIDLGLNINKQQFNNQLNGIAKGAESSVKRTFGGFGKLIGITLGATVVTGFVKSCLELGSNLAEVQNVVDVTFTTMSQKVTKFAKTAMAQFGLSETVTKKYMGTYGAMSKAFGYSEAQAYNMAEAITGLTADVASFYNLSTDEAYTKMKSIWTGETESLKDLGVVMTQSALDSYALAKGFGKTTAKMSEAEKVALRYKFVQEQLSAAQGDFSRTSGGWANQVRVLKLNFEGLKATLGQSFIVVFTPIVKWINILLTRLQVLATTFSNFVQAVFGKQPTNNAVASIAGDIGAVGDNANLAQNSVDGIGTSAEKSAKKAKKALAGFDEINILNLSNDEASNNALGDIDATVPKMDVTDWDNNIEKVNKNFDKLFDNIKNEYKKLGRLLKKGFEIGIGGDYKEKFNNIKDNITEIKNLLKNIFEDDDLQESTQSMINAFVKMLGTDMGSVIRIGATIGENLTGGIVKYLEQNENIINKRLTSVVRSWKDIFTRGSSSITAIANIFDVFGSETAQQITADVIAIFSNTFLGILDLGSRFVADFVTLVTQPITDNQEEIKLALENMLNIFAINIESIKNLVNNTFSKIDETYNDYISPMFEKFTEGTSKMGKAMLDMYNQYIAPSLEKMSMKWQDYFNNNLQPTIDKSIELFGKLGYALSLLWDNVIAPIIELICKAFGDDLGVSLEKGNEDFLNFCTIACKISQMIVDGLIEIIDAIILILESLEDFKNNWTIGMDWIIEKLGWAKDNFKTLWQNMWANLGEDVKKGLNGCIDWVNKFVNKINEKLKFTMPKILGGEEVKFAIPNIPKLARGGIVEQPTLAVVGERGKEAVMPLENNTEWITELAHKIVGIIGTTGNGNGGDTNLTIYLQVGEEQIVKKVIKGINRQTKIAGKTVITV